MQQSIDRERIEVALIDLLLLPEDAGAKTNRSKREGLKPARRMLWPIGQQGMSDRRGASQAKADGTDRRPEKVAARSIRHRGFLHSLFSGNLP
jgi:hypothetical protein